MKKMDGNKATRHKYLEISLNQHDNKIWNTFYKCQYGYLWKSRQVRVPHLEIVEIKIMILRALTLLVFEVVSDDNINFFVYIQF